MVIVRPGGSVPADGRVVDGSASMDEAMITGESKPVRRSVGDAGRISRAARLSMPSSSRCHNL